VHLRRWWFDRRVYEYFAANVAPLLGWRDPILVYQMGKVGSSSIRNSLFRSRDARTRLVLMSHEFYPKRDRDLDRLEVEPEYRDDVRREVEHDAQAYHQLSLRRRLGLRMRERFYSERIHDAYVAPGGALRVITLVRDPVAHNISTFFQVRERYVRDPAARATWNMDEHIAVFLQRYVHTRPLTWFDVEFRPMLGVDIYQRPFSHEQGYATLSCGHIEVLVLRCELEDHVKARAIGAFLGLERFEIIRSNITSAKPYGAHYAEFKRRIIIPERLLEKMYESKYARHFYSDDERARLRARWGPVAASRGAD